jgi:hypothetical protein
MTGNGTRRHVQAALRATSAFRSGIENWLGLFEHFLGVS